MIRPEEILLLVKVQVHSGQFQSAATYVDDDGEEDDESPVKGQEDEQRQAVALSSHLLPPGGGGHGISRHRPVVAEGTGGGAGHGNGYVVAIVLVQGEWRGGEVPLHYVTWEKGRGLKRGQYR